VFDHLVSGHSLWGSCDLQSHVHYPENTVIVNMVNIVLSLVVITMVVIILNLYRDCQYGGKHLVQQQSILNLYLWMSLYNNFMFHIKLVSRHVEDHIM